MVNDHHFERMDTYIQDARTRARKVIDLSPIDDSNKNIISTKILLNVNDDMLVMKEEIFGPLLPLKVYGQLSEV